MKLFLTKKIPIEYERLLSPHFESVTVETTSALKDADVIICQLTDPIDRVFLSKAPNLKHVATFSVGVDHVDTKALVERKIRLSHTPGVLTDATADLAWTLIMGCARRIKPAISFMEREAFEGFSPSLFLGVELKGATLGIVGWGKIGKAVAERAQGFGMKVIYHGRTSGSSLKELLETSDVISLHCPLTPETRHLIGEKELKSMKRNAILVNTARGPVVDEAALIRHLVQEQECFAGLDVYEREPEVPRELWELPNALCLPHIGSATERTRRKMAQICVDEAIRFANGKPLEYEYRS